jgi:hypothetical protein
LHELRPWKTEQTGQAVSGIFQEKKGWASDTMKRVRKEKSSFISL